MAQVPVLVYSRRIEPNILWVPISTITSSCTRIRAPNTVWLVLLQFRGRRMNDNIDLRLHFTFFDGRIMRFPDPIGGAFFINIGTVSDI